jgi:hypothetical protein
MLDPIPFSSSSVSSLEIHVPISPTPLFLNRIHYLAASLKEYGGALRDSTIVVTVGADEEPRELERELPWSRKYPIEWRWMDRELFREYSYFGTRLRRFTYDYEAEAVLMLDADVLVVGGFAEIVNEVVRRNVLCGTPAHGSPVRGHFTWEGLFAAAGLGEVPWSCEHPEWGLTFFEPERRFCPPYFNLGVLFSPRDHVRKIGTTIFAELDVVRKMEDFFRAQTSLTLAMVRQGIPWETMPLRYNFPNDPVYSSAYRREMMEMRLVHYLRKSQFDKDADFESPEKIAALLARTGWNEGNAVFMERLLPVHLRVLADLGRELPQLGPAAEPAAGQDQSDPLREFDWLVQERESLLKTLEEQKRWYEEDLARVTARAAEQHRVAESLLQELESVRAESRQSAISRIRRKVRTMLPVLGARKDRTK